ncbi:MAG: polysaccharide pyruvyl transferase family protein [Thermoflexales bacterium]|nr:polysaccharide pyruvyl transferase family protein [Thermoflexales bacterium]
MLGLHSARNSGDAALVSKAIAILRKYFPAEELVLSANDPDSYSDYADATIGSVVSSVWNLRRGNTFPRKLWSILSLPLALVGATLSYRVFGRALKFGLLSDQMALIDVIARARLIFACPGGYLYGRAGAGAFLGMLLPFVVARLFGKPTIYLSQSIGPCRSGWQRWMLRWILRDAGLIMTRERKSESFVYELLGGDCPRMIRTPDLGFGFRGASQEVGEAYLRAHGVRPPGESRRIGLTVIEHGVQVGRENCQAQYEEALWSAIDAYSAVAGIPIDLILLPQCAGPSPGEDDRNVFRRILDTHPASSQINIIFLTDQPSLNTLWSCYGNLDLLVATRMHSAIFAYCQGTPIIPLSYLYKMDGVMEDIGDGHVVLSSCELASSELQHYLRNGTAKINNYVNCVRRATELSASIDASYKMELSQAAWAGSP